MHSRFVRSLCLALLFGSTVAEVMAQEIRSRPVGYLVQTIPAGQTRSFSIPFDADISSLPGAVGRITAVDSSYIENSAANWVPGSLSAAATPYFVRLTSGTHAGRVFRVVTPANTATRLYVADDGIGLATLGLDTGANGTGFEIIPGDTLATFFGTTAPGESLVVEGTDSPATADIVQVWSGASWINFYYNTTWQRWARDIDTAADLSRNTFLLRPDRGIMITRRGSTPLEIGVIGRVLATPQRAFHARTENAFTFLATMQTGDVSLGTLALQSASRSSAWRGSSDSADADWLVVWSGASWLSFYYNNVTGHWQRVGDPTPSRDSFIVRAGTPVFVQRRQAGSTSNDKTIAFPAPGS